MLQLLSQARTSARALNKLNFCRLHHSATGRFTTISPQGTPVTREIEVWLGDPGDAYVMFDPEISRAFQTGTILRSGGSLAKDQELSPLNFHHKTRHFSHGILAYITAALELTHTVQNRLLTLNSRYPKIFLNNRMPVAAPRLFMPME